MSQLRITWDPRKAASNVRKHGVTFEEAETVFVDESALLRDDPEHSESEDRFVLLGLSAEFRILAVVHSYREDDRLDEIRIISARKGVADEIAEYRGRWWS